MDFRINDEKIDDTAEDPEGGQLSRDAFTELTLKTVGSSLKGTKIGLSQVLRLHLNEVNVESDDSSKKLFPFDSAIISLDFDF